MLNLIDRIILFFIPKKLSAEKQTAAKQFILFLISGGINTVVTYLIYLLCLLWFSYQVSFFLNYVIGIPFVFYLNNWLVFRTKPDHRKMLVFPLVYVVQYLLSALILHVGVEILTIDEKIVPLIAVILTIPVTFILSKIIIEYKKKNAAGS